LGGTIKVNVEKKGENRVGLFHLLILPQFGIIRLIEKSRFIGKLI
jgi:hypothetical protein